MIATFARPRFWRQGNCVVLLSALLVGPPILSAQTTGGLGSSGRPNSASIFPEIRLLTLSNGLQIYVVEQHERPSVAIRVVTASESQAPRGREGIAMMERVLNVAGTSNRPPAELARTLGGLGFTLDYRLSVDVASRHLDSALAVLADVLRRPEYSQERLEQYQRQRSSAFLAYATWDDFLASRVFWRHFYGPDYSNETVRSFMSISRADLLEHHERTYAPTAVKLVIVGDLVASRLHQQLVRVFGDWTPVMRGEEPRVRPAVDQLDRTRILLVDRPGAIESTVWIGQRGVTASSPDVHLVELLNRIIGDGPGSRLYSRLRQELGLSYSVTMRHGGADPASWYGYTKVDAGATALAVAEWMNIMREVRTTRPIQAEELRVARGALSTLIPLHASWNEGVALRLVQMAARRLPLDYFQRYSDRLARTTLQELNDAARRYLDPDHSIIVVVGDRRLIEGPLRSAGIGPVELVQE